MMKKLSVLAFTAALLLPASTAQAITILNFGQAVDGTPVTGTDNGDGTTTILATNLLVDITQFFDGNTYSGVYLNLNVTSVGDAIDLGGDIFQKYAGSFTITSAVDGGGTNYLSGAFTDALFGGGGQFALTASTSSIPADIISFSSEFGTFFPDFDLGFTFTNVTPDLHIVGTGSDATVGNFVAAVVGNFSADEIDRDVPVPEPGSMLLLGSGLMGLAASARRRLRRKEQ